MRPDPGPAPLGGRLPRRATDRIENVTAWTLGLLGLVLIIAAILIGIAVHADRLAEAKREAASWAQVEAVLLDATTIKPGGRGGIASVRVQATWNAPDGTPHGGPITVRQSRPAGSTTNVWVDRAGQIVPPPTRPVDAVVSGVTASLSVLSLGGGLLASLGYGVHRLLALANARSWDREWTQVEPDWRRRLP